MTKESAQFTEMVREELARREGARLYYCAIEGKETLHQVDTSSAGFETFRCLTPGCNHSHSVRTT